MKDLVREIAEVWAAGTPIVYLVTAEEERASALLNQVGQQFKATVAVWSSHQGLAPVDIGARDPLAALEALARAPAPLLAVMLDFHQALADPAVARRLRDLVPRFSREGRCLAIVAPRVAIPDGLVADSAVVRLPIPDTATLGTILDPLVTQIAADAKGPKRPPPAEARHRCITAALGLTAAQARRAFVRALRIDLALGPPALAAVLSEKKRILADDLGLELVEGTAAPEDLGGLDGFKSWLAERALAMKPDAARYGLPAPRGVLLLGVQGCGKSLSAKCAAHQLQVPLLRLDLPRVLGGGAHGSAEESLARALEAAEAIAPVALWVDEIEKGFAGSAPGHGGDSRASRLLGSFSTWLQERQRPVFVVATANDVSRLPPELLRRGRFDELFFVDLPDQESRAAILALHLRRRGRDPAKLDLAALARQCQDYSGAELEQVVVGALHRAFAEGRDLNEADLRRVAQDLVPLFKTYEEEIKALREWARGRARIAGRTGAVVDLFRRAGA
jgi:hypothetical protein